jgi:hypothetical protein
MPYTLELSSARAKLERAKIHINALRAEIDREGTPNPKLIPLRKQFEPEYGAIVWRIERVINISDDWSLIVGDAAHNLRCSLDHLAWQLALRRFNGVEPTDRKTIKEIQFPVCLDESIWDKPYVNRKHMLIADAEKLKQFQPFNLGPISRASGSIHPIEALGGFGGLDNTDKHRRIHMVNVAPQAGTFGQEGPIKFRDCEFVPNTINGGPDLHNSFPGNPPRPGNEILRIPVTPVGPNPDVNFEASLTGYVAIRETWDVLNVLDSISEVVAKILKLF